MITVPVSGRYKVDFRYLVNDHSHVAVETENLRVDHKESEALHFERSSSWTDTTAHVTLYKGANSLSIASTTSFGPNLDQITVSEESILERCVPGEVVPLKFLADATQREFIDSSGRIEAGELSGSFGGWIDLQKLGMWDIQITLKGGDLGAYASPKAWKRMEQGYASLTLGGVSVFHGHVLLLWFIISRRTEKNWPSAQYSRPGDTPADIPDIKCALEVSFCVGGFPGSKCCRKDASAGRQSRVCR
jgi:hypothetical protein